MRRNIGHSNGGVRGMKLVWQFFPVTYFTRQKESMRRTKEQTNMTFVGLHN